MAETPQVDRWIWGTETIIWGFDPSHRYTLKVLAPKKGREGCLSLQYHNEKSESWVQYSGTSWALLIVDGEVCTRVMTEGSVQNVPTGIIHRLMGVSDDCRILEPSTPDRHAADKSAPKDVIRLHCLLGRPISPPRNGREAALVAKAVELTEEACAAVERGETPPEYNRALLKNLGAFSL